MSGLLKQADSIYIDVCKHVYDLGYAPGVCIRGTFGDIYKIEKIHITLSEKSNGKGMYISIQSTCSKWLMSKQWGVRICHQFWKPGDEPKITKEPKK